MKYFGVFSMVLVMATQSIQEVAAEELSKNIKVPPAELSDLLATLENKRKAGERIRQSLLQLVDAFSPASPDGQNTGNSNLGPEHAALVLKLVTMIQAKNPDEPYISSDAAWDLNPAVLKLVQPFVAQNYLAISPKELSDFLQLRSIAKLRPLFTPEARLKYVVGYAENIQKLDQLPSLKPEEIKELLKVLEDVDKVFIEAYMNPDGSGFNERQINKDIAWEKSIKISAEISRATSILKRFLPEPLLPKDIVNKQLDAWKSVSGATNSTGMTTNSSTSIRTNGFLETIEPKRLLEKSKQ